MRSPGTALVAPRARLTDVTSTLLDFVITTFDVAPEKLAAYLPSQLTPERVVLDDGRERALISAVTFLNTRFFVQFAPFVRLTCEQTNYRAYVRHTSSSGAADPGVWFFGTGLASPFVLLPRHAWRLPWHRMHVDRRSTWQGERLLALSWHARASGADERLELEGTSEPLTRLDGFASSEATHAVLTHPFVGFLRRRDRRVVTYGVWHRPLVMMHAAPKVARFSRFEALGLVAPEQAPHSVLVQRQTEFIVRLPPRRIPAMDGSSAACEPLV